MHYTKVLVAALLAAPSMAGSPPGGYGYGGVTDTIVGESTAGPVFTETPSLITVTDSVTLTRPVTVTITTTVTVSRSCSEEEMTTTSAGTTRTTLTTRISIFIPGPESGASIITVPAPSISGEGESTATVTAPTELTTEYAPNSVTGSVTIYISGASSETVTGSAVSSINTESSTSCESTATSEDVDGVTGSLASTSTSTSTLSLGVNPYPESPTVKSGISHASTGMTATRTSLPLQTIPTTSLGVRGVIDVRLLAGAVGMVSFMLALAV